MRDWIKICENDASTDAVINILANCLAKSDEEFDPDWNYTPQAKKLIAELEMHGYTIQRS